VSCILWCAVFCTGESPSATIKLLSNANYDGNIVLKNVRCYVFLLRGTSSVEADPGFVYGGDLAYTESCLTKETLDRV
jgi:hypothetical protein